MLPDDARAIVRHGDTEFAGLAWCDRLSVGDHFKLDAHLGQDTGLFTGVQGVIHCLLDAREEGLPWIIKPEEMPVLSEKFRNGDFPLPRAHFHRRHLLRWFFWKGFVGNGRIECCGSGKLSGRVVLRHSTSYGMGRVRLGITKYSARQRDSSGRRSR